jgi:hypothetical protein
VVVDGAGKDTEPETAKEEAAEAEAEAAARAGKASFTREVSDVRGTARTRTDAVVAMRASAPAVLVLGGQVLIRRK